ncbi:metallophosphoesterase [Erwinia typographi]|uniref:Metallophosphoesterase n=1 Tax=Erwinia typographi TaxID=371042 RepID=A0A0A3ZAB1_9GAMM|nr:metallophosphoesterase [Erwinia typographi]KGT95982.1 metallophosphoesterase [Erwinia typographi]
MLIAQVSDIHASHHNDNLLRFDRALEWLEQIKPDVLVLSGDLIDDQWYDGYQQISDRLSQKKWPSLILPGNSDDRHMMRSAWKEYAWADDAPDESLHFVHESGDLRLIGLDSTVEGTASGCVVRHLEWLEKQLLRKPAYPSLLFLHHHVFESGIPTLDSTLCEGATELADLLNRLPGKPAAIASGHVHRPVAGVFAGIPAYICGSICPANPLWFGTENVPLVNDPPALMIHRYVDNAMTSYHVSV